MSEGVFCAYAVVTRFCATKHMSFFAGFAISRLDMLSMRLARNEVSEGNARSLEPNSSDGEPQSRILSKISE